MKNKFFAFLTVSGCATSLIAPLAAQEAAPAQTTPQALSWKWRVQPKTGARYQMRCFVRSETQFPRRGKNAAFDAVTMAKATLDLDVLKRDAKGATAMRLTYRALEADHQISDASRTPAQQKAWQQKLRSANALYKKATLNQSFTFKVAPDGTVSDLDERELSRRRLHVINSINVSPSLDDFEMSLVENLSGLFLAPVPAAPLQIGQTLNYAAPYPQASRLILQWSGKRTLRSVKNGVAQFEETATADTPPEMRSTGIPYEISGDTKGKVSVDMATGLTREINSSARLTPKVVDSDANSDFFLQPYTVQLQSRFVIEPR